MKITKLTTFMVPPRWLFLNVETDAGVTGWGEPVVEGRAETVAACGAELADYLVGKDPSPIEDHWTVLYRGGFYRGGAIHVSAQAGIDQALWDIQGKVLIQPVHALLGGPVRRKMPVYSWIGGDRPDAIVKGAREVAAKGFTAFKMLASEELGFLGRHAKLDAVIARGAALREAMGPGFGIAVDFHGRVHRPMAKDLDPFPLMFIEELVLSEHAEALKEIANQTATPIAFEERLFSRWDFKNILSDGLVDIVQPDPSHACGITETRKIAAMAESYDVGVALHCPLGPIALAACLQPDAVCYHAVIKDQSLGIHYNAASDLSDYISDPSVFAYADRHVAIPKGPGLSIAIDEEAVMRGVMAGRRWRPPGWRHQDGSFAE